AVGPWVALKLFGTAPYFHPSRPFWFGAAALGVAVLIAVLSQGVIRRAHAAAPAPHTVEEAEAVLVGDLD
ncbi:MAG TPA: MFS transporter, partial [Nocardioides sp.]|nr:MFS transporter [Nocardioides sp.]